MNEQASASSRAWSAVRREPLVLFVLLGVGVFGAWAALAPDDARVVRIEPLALRALETQREELLGRALTEDERENLREGYIDDEVLLHEALRRGLQRSDSRVRQRLIRIMRGALTENVADPSVAQLQAHFRDNIDRFTSPESVSFEQVLFPWGEEVTEDELDRVLAGLRSGADASNFGSTSMIVGRRMPRQTRGDLVRTFGADFADRMERLPPGEWHGPVESVLGVHLVRVMEHHPPQVAEFENVESYLRQDWLMTRTRELQQERVDEIRAGYRIEFADE